MAAVQLRSAAVSTGLANAPTHHGTGRSHYFYFLGDTGASWLAWAHAWYGPRVAIERTEQRLEQGESQTT